MKQKSAVIPLVALDELTSGIPWTTTQACHLLHRLAVELKAVNVLDVATGYGRSAAYLAHAVNERNGKVFTMDLKRRSFAKRTPDQLIKAAGLEANVNMSFGIDARVSMLRLFSERPGSWVDLAFLDASHTVELDSFLGVALWAHLRPGGILVLDDLEWTASKHGAPRSGSILPRQKHVRMIFEYLRRMPDALDSFEWGEAQIGWSYGVLQKSFDDKNQTAPLLARKVIEANG